MTAPFTHLTIKDGALGITPANTPNIQVKVGVCSQGPTNVLQSFSSVQLLKDTMGAGPLVDSAVMVILRGGGPVLVMRVLTSATATTSSVTKVGTGTGTMTVAGNALDAFKAKVQIVQTGATITSGTGSFRYSLDNGQTWSSELAIPTGGTFPVPSTGLTLTFVNGMSGTSFVAGDTHSFTTTAIGYSLSELNVAFTALLADPRKWAWAHVVGAADSVADSATMAVAMASQMAAAEVAYRYAFVNIECPTDTDANLIAGFASFVSTRVSVWAGTSMVLSPVSGNILERSSAWEGLALAGSRQPQVDVAYTDEGGELLFSTSIVRDEGATPALDNARFSTLTSQVGLPGFFVTNARLMAPPGSDFELFQYRRVMDIASAAGRAWLLLQQSKIITVDRVTGKILEADAMSFEEKGGAKIRNTVTQGGYAEDVQLVVDRTVNLLSTQTFRPSIRVLPFAYAKYIEADIGFDNPALSV